MRLEHACRLWDHVTVPCLPGPRQAVPYKALCALLPDLIRGSALAAATTVGFLRGRLGQLDGTNTVLGLLRSVAPALRRAS